MSLAEWLVLSSAGFMPFNRYAHLWLWARRDGAT
jgi:hypothetical protein